MKRLLAICLAVSAISACKDDAQSKSQTSASAAPTQSAIPDDFVVNSFFAQSKNVAVAVDGSVAFGEPGTDTGGGEKVKIVDAGGEPKTKLAYAFVLAKAQTIAATITEEVSGPDIPEGQGKQPPVKVTLTTTAKKKDGPKTQIELAIAKFEMVGAPPELATKLAPLQASLAKVTASYTVGANGETGDLEFAGAESLQRGPGEQILSMVARVQSVLYIPLPTAPVGPGAKWKTTVSQEAATVESIYTFVGKTEAGYAIKLETSSMAAPKTMQDPRSQKKITLEVKGGATYDLTTLLDGPTYKGTGESKTGVIMSENQGPKRTNNEKMSLVIEKGK
jgi:hypothetical protein